MPTLLNTSDAAFKKTFRNWLDQDDTYSPDVVSTVSDIIKNVRKDGDRALIDYSKKFDKLDLTPENIRITKDELDAATAECSDELLNAIDHAIARVTAYHEKQLPSRLTFEDKHDNLLGWRWHAIDAVGLYVPGGRASYPSSVIMNAIPAKIAGVSRIAMVVPTPNGEINPLVLATAQRVGIKEIYRVGGAQAVAALAYGTDTIAPVDKIVGPGNAYVAEAKRQVFGRVGIDMIAGPSEILVIADSENDPEWVATDLLSQAEHDEAARSILLTPDAEFADNVIKAIEATLPSLDRESIASKSWEDHGLVIITRDLIEASDISNIIAPEHLELCVKDIDALLPKLRNAGAIFMGKYTPEAIGDYIAGPSHVLPTSGSARFFSGLDVFAFIKRSTLIRCTEDGFNAIADDAATLAESEGLDAHQRSILIRKNDVN